MSGEDRQKFDFYRNLIDKLFEQLNEMHKWDGPFLENNLDKVAHALIEIKQLNLFFEKYEDFMIYQDKGVQIQDKIKSLLKNLHSTEKLLEAKVESKSTPASVGKEAKSIDKPAKTDIDYSKISLSHYKKLIESTFDDLLPNVSNNKPKINPKPVVVSSNNSAPKLHFPVVAAKAFDPQSSILTPVKEPTKPNVLDKLKQELVRSNKPEGLSNNLSHSAASNLFVSSELRFCPTCGQKLPQQGRNDQSHENFRERNVLSFRGRRPNFNHRRGHYLNFRRFNLGGRFHNN